MTAFPGAGSALDRVGGELALRAIVEEAIEGRPSRTLEVGIDEEHADFTLDLLDGDGGWIAELRRFPVARSAAIRDDQVAQLRADAEELEPIIRRLAGEIREAAIPELEKRAMDGDR